MALVRMVGSVGGTGGDQGGGNGEGGGRHQREDGGGVQGGGNGEGGGRHQREDGGGVSDQREDEGGDGGVAGGSKEKGSAPGPVRRRETGQRKTTTGLKRNYFWCPVKDCASGPVQKMAQHLVKVHKMDTPTSVKMAKRKVRAPSEAVSLRLPNSAKRSSGIRALPLANLLPRNVHRPTPPHRRHHLRAPPPNYQLSAPTTLEALSWRTSSNICRRMQAEAGTMPLLCS